MNSEEIEPKYMKPKCPIKRRSVRLLNAIHELHRQGYQNLACYCYMSPSGFHWRLELKHFDDLFIDTEGEVQQLHDFDAEIAHHTSGQSGHDYFAWEDAKNANARALAELIKRRFPRLLQSCIGQNFEYAGWFVYLLGEAENEKLPLFFLEYNNTKQGRIFSTVSNQYLLTPPHLELNTKNNIKWLWVNNVDVTKNWHTAYQPIIDSIRETEIRRFPKYPSHTKDLSAHAAYWEGAVYYLKTIMNYSSEKDYISDRINTNSRWEQFEIIYNSQGQLHLLDAHMARVALDNDSQEMSEQLKVECKSSLRDIQLLYQEDEYPFPNPYFGGHNPLHLANL